MAKMAEAKASVLIVVIAMYLPLLSTESSSCASVKVAVAHFQLLN